MDLAFKCFWVWTLEGVVKHCDIVGCKPLGSSYVKLLDGGGGKSLVV